MVPLPLPVFTATVKTVLSVVVTPVIEVPETPDVTNAKSSASTPSTGWLNVAVKVIVPGVIPLTSWLVVVIETVGMLILYVTMAAAQAADLLSDPLAAYVPVAFATLYVGWMERTPSACAKPEGTAWKLCPKEVYDTPLLRTPSAPMRTSSA